MFVEGRMTDVGSVGLKWDGCLPYADSKITHLGPQRTRQECALLCVGIGGWKKTHSSPELGSHVQTTRERGSMTEKGGAD